MSKYLCSEFFRNRETRILESIKNFGEIKKVSIPRLFEHYKDIDQYRELNDNIRKIHKDLIKTIRKEILDRKLPADVLFDQLIQEVVPVELDVMIIDLARERTERGDPPGKEGSFGDRLHWEFLLNVVGSGNDLHIVSRDSDFASRIESTEISPFLESEWKNVKASNLILHTNIGKFFDIFPKKINIIEEKQREKCISRLENSGSYERTHKALRELGDFIITFSEQDIERIVEALFDNSQIKDIRGDSDVIEFYKKIIEIHSQKIDKSILAKLKVLLNM